MLNPRLGCSRRVGVISGDGTRATSSRGGKATGLEHPGKPASSAKTIAAGVYGHLPIVSEE